jgi:hypothetical protein
VQRVQNAAQNIALQNQEEFMNRAMMIPPQAYMDRAAQLEAQANEESYDADNAKELVRQAQRMRFMGGEVLKRHQQINAQVAFQDDASRVLEANSDLFLKTHGRGKAMIDLFSAFPQLQNLPNGASIALKVVNMFYKNKREQGR